jgi:cobalt/nickel transport system permease protein
VILEVFSEGDSRIHRFDPRAKLVLAVVCAVLIALAQKWTTVAMAALVPVAGLVIARLEFRLVLFRLALVNAFVAAMWIFVPFSYPGETVFEFGPLAASSEGIRYALLITARANLIVLTMIVFLGTSNVFSLAHALSHFHAPQKLVHLFFFCYRYVHVIHEEYLRLRAALKARAFRPGTNRHTYKTYGYLAGMLLVRSRYRAQRIYGAMRCRGFHGEFMPLEHFHQRLGDTLSAIAALAFLAAAAWIEWGGFLP